MGLLLTHYARPHTEILTVPFMLHQATERLLACLLLVVQAYAPHNHNIAFLRTQAERLDRRMIGIWPEGTRKERAMFQKLKEAYTKARYSKLCRVRHNFDYAEPISPKPADNPALLRLRGIVWRSA